MFQTKSAQAVNSSNSGNSPSLVGKVLFITGASRGIGEAIALRAARDGAKIAVIGKTDQPHPKLKGTVHTACQAIEAASGQAIACAADIRDDTAMEKAVKATVDRFGGIDILVNNAAAISLTSLADTPMKRFDLMHGINTRGAFLCCHLCLPYLKKSANPHILMLSPPPRLLPEWFSGHVAYTSSKYSMSLFTLGFAHELAPFSIAVNSLWPKTIIATAAVENLLGPERLKRCRYPAIVADAAHAIVTRPSKEFTGQFCIDEEILKEVGITDFTKYAVDPSQEPEPDFYI
jgi:citronellol/citronellal dehydrogenase